MRNAFLVIAATMFLCRAASASSDWPNEPAGSTNAFDCPFSNSTCGLQDVYKSARYSADAAAPLSPSSILDEVLAPNATTGGGQFIVNLASVREVYVGTWWKTNPEFQGMYGGSIANKMIFISGNGNNNFLNWSGPPDGVRNLMWANQSEQNNCHVAGWNGDGTCGGGSGSGKYGSGAFSTNVSGAGNIAAGTGWHRIEIYQRASTSDASRDGIIRLWIDGTLTTSYTNLNLSPGGFTDVQYNHTWDGSAALQCYPASSIGRDCNRAWHHMWDHLRVSIPNNAVFNDPPRIVTSSTLSSARTGTPYSVTLAAEGGKQPYAWFHESGNLPNGLTLNQSTGVISGTPTCVGRSDFTIRVTDSNQPALTATKSYTIITSGTGTCTSGMEEMKELTVNGLRLTVEQRIGSVTIRPKQNGPASITIHDLTGREVWRHTGSGEAVWNHGGRLKKGIYLVRAEQGGRTMVANYCNVR